MVVYVEWVIADNLALDILLAYLTRILLRQKASLWRILFSAAVGTALVFPFLYIAPLWARILYKFAVLSAVCLPLSDSLRLWRKCLVVYAVLSAAFGGLYYLFAGSAFELSFGAISTTGGRVALLAASVTIGLYLVRQVRGLVRELRLKRHSVKVQLFNGERFVFVSGFYDSGNTVLAPNGKGVVFLSPKVQSTIGTMSEKGQIEVRTVLGKNTFALYQIDAIKIYRDGQVNTIERVNVAYSRDNLSGCDALLPYNL